MLEFDNYRPSEDILKALNFAEHFTQLLTEENFEKAYGFLHSSDQKNNSVKDIHDNYHAMMQMYFEGKQHWGEVQYVHIGEEGVLKAWPDKEPEDIVWAYLSIVGENYCEGIALIVAKEKGDMKIKQMIWGRP